MFNRPTVFVIGAGASYELGLPLGVALRDKIAQDAENASARQVISSDIFDRSVLRSGVPNINGNAALKLRQLANGLQTKDSIDSYLDFHQADTELVALGKFCIAYQILAAESGSKLQKDGQGNYRLNGLAGTYLPKLFSAMNEGTTKANPERIFANVSFICFNYDRCIETYMFLAVQALIGCTPQDAFGISSNLKIWHPYGSVGSLWHQMPPLSERSIRFGLSDEQQPANAWRDLRTFTENVSDTGLQASIHAEIENAYRIVFLGFSYLEQNMRLLTPPNAIQATEIVGTSLGLSNYNMNIAQALAQRAFKDASRASKSIAFTPQTATQYLSDAANYLRS